jgi:hypothetical protein
MPSILSENSIGPEIQGITERKATEFKSGIKWACNADQN